jgi:hypothetical protein
MPLDEETQRIAEEVMGTNVLRQLGMAVPDFWDKDYMIVRMVPKPEDQQSRHFPFVVALEPKVMASKNPRYPVGRLIGFGHEMMDAVREGYNLAVSPNEIRGNWIVRHKPKFLDEEPRDRLVCAEVELGEHGFAGPDVFYEHAGHLVHGREILYGHLNEENFSVGVCRCNIHFAFVQKGETPRKIMAMEKTFAEGLHTSG